MHFFTADEHFEHRGIIGYCDHPFSSLDEMDREIIRRHNEVVGMQDTVIHVGDFTLRGSRDAADYALQLNGRHVFLPGSHDG